MLPLIEALTKQFNFAEVIPISARKRDGLDLLVGKIVGALPKGERYFPKEQYTDQPQRFMVAELIRESILLETGEEVPYASAVVIERFEEPKQFVPRKKGATPARLPLTRIAAAIYCERDGTEGNSDWQRRREAEGDWHGRAEKDRIAAGHAGVSGAACDCGAGLARVKELCRTLDWRNQLERLGVDQSTEPGEDDK